MDSALISRFVDIVGARYALTEPADTAPFVEEERRLWTGATPLVLRPANTAEVSAILKLATETCTPIVPQGGNTGLVGAQTPDKSNNQVVLSLSRLNRVREIDVKSNTMIVEAGVILENLHKAADAVDRLFPLSLASQGTCQIGGNMSANAGGVNALSYGVARDLCLGLEVVLPTGEVLYDLRKLKKDNTGYDLKDLFIGAEGTLGVITALVVKLFPKPKSRDVAWIGLKSSEAALELLGRASSAAGAALTAFELIHRRAIDYMAAHFPQSPCPVGVNHEWFVLLEISSGRSDDDARQLSEAILGDALEDGLIDDAAISENLTQANKFWQFREEIPESQKPEGASIKHDISVPVNAIPEFIARAGAEVERICPGARPVCFGHMGDGNLHYNISQPVGWDAKAFLELYRPMNDAVHAVVRALGGSFSAEHGIGQMKRAELLATEQPIAIDLMRRIKTAFDPAGIMNPGKVI